MENINLKKPVYDFLNAHRSLESGETITHLSYGNFRGKFNLNEEEEKQFLKLYIKAIDNGVNDFSILEKPTKYSPIIIDIDLKINKSEYKGCKLYTKNKLKKLLKHIIQYLNKCLNIMMNLALFLKKMKKYIMKKKKYIKMEFTLYFLTLCVSQKLGIK